MKSRLGYFAVLALFAHQAETIEPLSTTELVSHCAHYSEDPEGKDAIFCVHYIQGFIDGAIATDERVAQNVVAQYERAETFTERAFRTRTPSRVVRFGPTAYADFCLGAPVPLVEVVTKVVGSLSESAVQTEHPLARDAVFSTLRGEYACQYDEE